jgi:hypothetical protein
MALGSLPPVTLIIAAFLLLAGPAAAQSPDLDPAPFKVPPTGTRLVWQNLDSGQRQVSVIGESDGMIVRWTWQGHPGASLGHFCMDCLEAEAAPDGGFMAPLYPLEVGKAVLFNRSRGGNTWQDEIRVVGTDRLETPAGSFETFVVRRRSRTPDESWRAEQRNWYDPKLGWVLKFEAFDNQGGRERWQVIQLNYPSD